MDYQEQVIITFEQINYELNNGKSILINKLKGSLLELLTCIKYKCKLYEDISYEFKEQYNLSYKDDGIDCIDETNDMIYQVKCYEKIIIFLIIY